VCSGREGPRTDARGRPQASAAAAGPQVRGDARGLGVGERAVGLAALRVPSAPPRGALPQEIRVVSSEKGVRLAQKNASWSMHSCGNTTIKCLSWPNFWANLAAFSLWWVSIFYRRVGPREGACPEVGPSPAFRDRNVVQCLFFNLSVFPRCIPTGIHWPACIVWANLTLSSPRCWNRAVDEVGEHLHRWTRQRSPDGARTG
jgi:hypothetical protein